METPEGHPTVYQCHHDRECHECGPSPLCSTVMVAFWEQRSVAHHDGGQGSLQGLRYSCSLNELTYLKTHKEM